MLRRLDVSKVNQMHSDKCQHTLALMQSDSGGLTLGCAACLYKLGPDDFVIQLKAPLASFASGTVAELLAADYPDEPNVPR